jgi:hypothetical protein
MYKGKNLVTGEVYEYEGTLRDFYRIMLYIAKGNLAGCGEARIRIYHDNWPLFALMGAYDFIDVVRPDFTFGRVYKNPLIRPVLVEAENY